LETNLEYISLFTSLRDYCLPGNPQVNGVRFKREVCLHRLSCRFEQTGRRIADLLALSKSKETTRTNAWHGPSRNRTRMTTYCIHGFGIADGVPHRLARIRETIYAATGVRTPSSKTTGSAFIVLPTMRDARCPADTCRLSLLRA